MEGRTGIKDGRWINVVERGIKNDGSYNVGLICRILLMK